MNLQELSDPQLKHFIMKIFKDYDKNNNGTLQAPQIALFFKDLYKSLGYDITISLPTALQVIREISQTGTNSVNPYEVYLAFKQLTNNTSTYFEQFSLCPFFSKTSHKGQQMDVENCKEWQWPQQ